MNTSMFSAKMNEPNSTRVSAIYEPVKSHDIFITQKDISNRLQVSLRLLRLIKNGR